MPGLLNRIGECSFRVIGRDALKHALFIYNGMTNIYSLIF